MKPHEETWAVDCDEFGHSWVARSEGGKLGDVLLRGHSHAAAKLAAQAPAMFRVLLDVLNGVRDQTAFIDADAILGVLRDAGLPPAVKATDWVCPICVASVKAGEEHYCNAGVIP